MSSFAPFSTLYSLKVFAINDCFPEMAQPLWTNNAFGQLRSLFSTVRRVRCCYLFMLQTNYVLNEGCSIMHKEHRSQMEMSIPGTPTSVHLRWYTVNLQMREFSIHGTSHNHHHGGGGRTMAHQEKKQAQMREALEAQEELWRYKPEKTRIAPSTQSHVLKM